MASANRQWNVHIITCKCTHKGNKYMSNKTAHTLQDNKSKCNPVLVQASTICVFIWFRHLPFVYLSDSGIYWLCIYLGKATLASTHCWPGLGIYSLCIYVVQAHTHCLSSSGIHPRSERSGRWWVHYNYYLVQASSHCLSIYFRHPATVYPSSSGVHPLFIYLVWASSHCLTT